MLGPEHPDSLDTRNSLGISAPASRQVTEAEAEDRELLSSKKKCWVWNALTR